MEMWRTPQVPVVASVEQRICPVPVRIAHGGAGSCKAAQARAFATLDKWKQAREVLAEAADMRSSSEPAMEAVAGVHGKWLGVADRANATPGIWTIPVAVVVAIVEQTNWHDSARGVAPGAGGTPPVAVGKGSVAPVRVKPVQVGPVAIAEWIP